MDDFDEEKLDANMYNQIWSSKDLKPDYITSHLNKIFSYNYAETKCRHNGDKYYDFNTQYANSLSKLTGFNSTANILRNITRDIEISLPFNVIELDGVNCTTARNIISWTNIKRAFDEMSIIIQDEGGKIILKSYQVYELTDIIDNLQVALLEIELTTEKTNNAIIRTINTLNLPLIFNESFTGMIDNTS